MRVKCNKAKKSVTAKRKDLKSRLTTRLSNFTHNPNSSPDNGGEMPGDIGLNEDEVMLDEIDPFSIVSQENVSLIV